MKTTLEGSVTILEFECHLDLQEDSSNRWRIRIQTEQNKPHRNQTSIAQEFTVSFTIILFVVTIVYIEIIQMHGV